MKVYDWDICGMEIRETEIETIDPSWDLSTRQLLILVEDEITQQIGVDEMGLYAKKIRIVSVGLRQVLVMDGKFGHDQEAHFYICSGDPEAARKCAEQEMQAAIGEDDSE